MHRLSLEMQRHARLLTDHASGGNFGGRLIVAVLLLRAQQAALKVQEVGLTAKVRQVLFASLTLLKSRARNHGQSRIILR